MVERFGAERGVAAPEADWQLVAMSAAAHEQGPVGTMVGYPDRGVGDRLPVQEPGDHLADRVVCGPKRAAEGSSECGRVAGPHAAQVVVPAQPNDSPTARCPRANPLLQHDPAGWAGPSGRPGDLDGIARRIGKLEIVAAGEPEVSVHALIDGRPERRGDQRPIDPEHAVQVGWTKNHRAEMHVASRRLESPDVPDTSSIERGAIAVHSILIILSIGRPAGAIYSREGDAGWRRTSNRLWNRWTTRWIMPLFARCITRG